MCVAIPRWHNARHRVVHGPAWGFVHAVRACPAGCASRSSSVFLRARVDRPVPRDRQTKMAKAAVSIYRARSALVFFCDCPFFHRFTQLFVRFTHGETRASPLQTSLQTCLSIRSAISCAPINAMSDAAGPGGGHTTPGTRDNALEGTLNGYIPSADCGYSAFLLQYVQDLSVLVSQSMGHATRLRRAHSILYIEFDSSPLAVFEPLHEPPHHLPFSQRACSA